MKNKIRTYGDKVHTIFCNLNVPEDGIKCESFTVIYIHSLLVYESKYFLQLFLESCAYKIIDRRIIDYLGENLFASDKNQFLINRFNKSCVTTELIYAEELCSMMSFISFLCYCVAKNQLKLILSSYLQLYIRHKRTIEFYKMNVCQ